MSTKYTLSAVIPTKIMNADETAYLDPIGCTLKLIPSTGVPAVDANGFYLTSSLTDLFKITPTEDLYAVVSGADTGAVSVTSTNISGFSLDSTVVVTSAAQLAGALLSDKVYLIDGIIDMGTTQIAVPQGGLNIRGNGFGVSGLISSQDAYTMFIDDGVYAGDLFLEAVYITTSGTGSKVFDADNAENGAAIEFNDVNFVSCTSLGVLKNYRQMLTRNVAFIEVADGLELDGVWSGGATIRDTIVIEQPASSTVFKAGASLLIQNAIRTNINAASMDNTAVLFDFAPANIARDGGMSLSGVIVNSASDALPNFPSSDVKAFFKNCIGLDNTYRGGTWTISSDVETTVSAADTLYKLAGTTTYSDLQWFSQTSDNALVYDADQDISVDVSGVISIDGSANRQIGIQLRKWDTSAGAYVNIGPEFRTTLNGGLTGTRAENTSFHVVTTVSQDDRIEVWAKNITDTTDFTAAVGGILIVGERPQ